MYVVHVSVLQCVIYMYMYESVYFTYMYHLLDCSHVSSASCFYCSEWESLEHVGLVLGEVSTLFAAKTVASLFMSLYELAKNLSLDPENILAFYQLLFLLTLAFSHKGINDMLLYLNKLQDLAVKERQYPSHHRVALHATVAGILYLVSNVSTNEILKEHVAEIISRRKAMALVLLPDSLFAFTEEANAEHVRGVVSREEEEEVLGEVAGSDSQCLFDLQSEGILKSPGPSRGSSVGMCGKIYTVVLYS